MKSHFRRMMEGWWRGWTGRDFFFPQFFFLIYLFFLFRNFSFLFASTVGVTEYSFFSWHCGGSAPRVLCSQLLSPLECRWMMYDFPVFFYTLFRCECAASTGLSKLLSQPEPWHTLYSVGFFFLPIPFVANMKSVYRNELKRWNLYEPKQLLQ